ncbi:MAG: ABC transporter ATP-binding protein [Eubacteriales bacterium]
MNENIEQKIPAFNKGTVTKILKYLGRYKKNTALLIFFMINVAVVDTLFPQMTKIAIDDFIVPGSLEGIQGYIIKFAFLALWQSINIIIFISIAGKIEMDLTYDIRNQAFRKLQELSLSYYDTTSNGWIMARLTSDVRRLGEIISWGIVDIVWGFSSMLLIGAFMFYYNARLAFIGLSVIPLLILISFYFQRKILAEYRIVRKMNSNITSAFSEGITGAKTTKSLVLEEENYGHFKELTFGMKAASVRAAVFSSLFLPISVSLGAIGISLLLWAGGKDVLLGSVSYGVLVLFISYITQFFEPVRELARVIAEFQQAQASAERVFSLLETPSDIHDTPEVIRNFGDIFEHLSQHWPQIKGEIEFRNVVFQYSKGETILHSFNLKVNQGQRIAFVGETGSGKSTIVNLLCRFYEPTKGEILIDGVNYLERSISWMHSNLGYVLQSPHLFSGTIKENIRFGKLNATDEEIFEATRLVNAHNFIMELEKGYDTQVGESGGKLSTGEKQLISFARAIIARPKIFILDEATSSVDTETESIIQKTIHTVLEGRTSFVIAHRLSTIVSCDRILVIKKGLIIEDGNHQELLKKRGYYYKLYTNQFQKGNVI